MKELAILLRAMQLYTQNAHNLVEKSILQQLPSKETENMLYFQRIESMENNLRQKIAQINPGVSIGTQQLIGGMADESEKRSYKIKQRIKGGK
jgi:DNA-binding ferritin-like protein